MASLWRMWTPRSGCPGRAIACTCLSRHRLTRIPRSNPCLVRSRAAECATPPMRLHPTEQLVRHLRIHRGQLSFGGKRARRVDHHRHQPDHPFHEPAIHVDPLDAVEGDVERRPLHDAFPDMDPVLHDAKAEEPPSQHRHYDQREHADRDTDRQVLAIPQQHSRDSEVGHQAAPPVGEALGGGPHEMDDRERGGSLPGDLSGRIGHASVPAPPARLDRVQDVVTQPPGHALIDVGDGHGVAGQLDFEGSEPLTLLER